MDTAKREEVVLVVPEYLKEHVAEALKMREELRDDFEECRQSCDEAEVI